MWLCYHKLRGDAKNFGDDLNPWLWDRLLPGMFDGDEQVAFVGIGTLINDALMARTRHASKRIIFGTGVGYGKGLLSLDDSFTIYALRGPRSAAALGVSPDLAMTDGAALIRTCFQPTAQKTHQWAYMPHYELAGEGWRRVCEALGFLYIDPRQSVEVVLHQISQTELLLTEAMHGAIIADALRIPWVPIVTNSSILSFKWQDWCESIKVPYQPIVLKRLHHPNPKQDVLSPVRMTRDWWRQREAMAGLTRATQQAPVLSTDTQISTLTNRLEEALHRLKQDVAAGVFAELREV